MEEKILIKSEIDQNVKNFLQKVPGVLFAISGLILLFLSLPHSIEVDGHAFGYIGWSYVFWFALGTIRFFILFVVCVLCLIAAIVFTVIYFANRDCELQVTENNVRGKTLYGEEVVLPLYMVSAYSTRKFLSVITVATSSGFTKFSLIGNYKEIGDTLAAKINERQEKTETNTKQTSGNQAMDDLVKLKSLLDSGIISQEEFDAKKKQLLGL